MLAADRIRALHVAALDAMEPDERAAYLAAIVWRRMVSVGAFPLTWVVAR